MSTSRPPNNALQPTARPRSASAERYIPRGAALRCAQGPRNTALRLRGALLVPGRRLNAKPLAGRRPVPERTRLAAQPAAFFMPILADST